MQNFTPPATGSGNLRKSALLRHVSNSAGPSKKRSSHIINQSLVVQEDVDDELERSQSHRETDIQSHLSRISSPKSPQLNVNNEKEIRDHFQICLKMYAENKINSKNAWNLKIIDYMRAVLDSQGLTKDSLQVASTSLDVSAKIYGIRVDDVHAAGLQLASNMARVHVQDAEDGGVDQDECSADADGNNENAGPGKQKRNRMFFGRKTTIVKDPKSLLGDVLKLQSTFFQTRTDPRSSPTDNLFTNRLPMNHGCYKFMLLSKEPAWPTYNKKDPNINFEKSYPFQFRKVSNLQICAPFADFEIDEWDPAQEAQLLEDESNTPGLEEQIAYDSAGIPISELDGSIHDLFANADAENQSANFEQGEGNGLAQNAVLTDQAAHIVHFRPEENGLRADDYSYACLTENIRITQVWAGPSHWKLKHLRQTISRFSGQSESQTKRAAKRTHFQPALVDYSTDIPGFNKSKLYKIKQYKIDENPTKITLPLIGYIDDIHCRTLMLKPVLRSTINETKNQNDTLYCSQNAMHDGNYGPADDGDGDSQNEEDIAMPQRNFLRENLVDAPELVPKTYINHALQAKKMDMKKLKVAVWKSLVCNTPNEVIPNEGMYEREVTKKKFSEIYKEIPGRISKKMRQELSCPLAFVALLHLANEQNLDLTAQSDLSDFTVEQLTHFTE